MPITRPIPKNAMPVVNQIRRDIPKPDILPSRIRIREGSKNIVLRWNKTIISKPIIGSVIKYFCPMGLHKLSSSTCPISKYSFADEKRSNIAIIAFYTWWDKQIDAQAAVDAVWGK